MAVDAPAGRVEELVLDGGVMGHHRLARQGAQQRWQRLFQRDRIGDVVVEDPVNHGGRLGYRGIRRFVIEALGDAVAYRRVTCAPGQIAVYEEIHERVRAEVRRLREELQAARGAGSAEVPLVVLCHSLGGHVMSNYIWDMQQGTPVLDTFGGTPFEEMKTLCGFMTIGSNLPLFALRVDDLQKIQPITFPPEELDENMVHIWKNIYDPDVELLQVRKQIGMVFQRPNPLPLSIRDNVLFGYNVHMRKERASRSQKDEIVEAALTQVLLWDKVKDRLNAKATELSLEEQQKLCIARLLPVKPTLLLMDEPCSALDPKGTEAVEELIWELRGQYSILIVTHNMAQARRASEECIFMLLGKVIEHSATAELFVTPANQETADYIEGRYG